jgi:hypothetical protein
LSQSREDFAGVQEDFISREDPERIKPGGRGGPKFREKSGTSICTKTTIATVCGGKRDQASD